jgi:uncharacterized protein YceK
MPALALCLAGSGGCASLSYRSWDEGLRQVEPGPYPGVRTNCRIVETLSTRAGPPENRQASAYLVGFGAVVDIPGSFLLDTVMCPYDFLHTRDLERQTREVSSLMAWISESAQTITVYNWWASETTAMTTNALSAVQSSAFPVRFFADTMPHADYVRAGPWGGGLFCLLTMDDGTQYAMALSTRSAEVKLLGYPGVFRIPPTRQNRWQTQLKEVLESLR